MIDNKQIEDFFRSMKDIDRDLITIEEFKHQIKKVQGKFDDLE